jgi:hypothetical protein
VADPREVFPVLEDASTQAGLPIHKVAQGDALAGKNAVPVLGFKDASGNLRYPKVDAQDRILTNSDVGDEACLFERGEHTAGSASFVTVTGALITLQADLQYHSVGFIVSCRRSAHFQIVQVDDATENILADIILEGGQPTASEELHCVSFTAGSTGTQALKVVGKNFEALSALRATVAVTEVQP